MNRYLAWSPDGKRIVFTSDVRGVHDVYVMSPAGGRLRQLTEESP
jgi:Tol biopolymer transport system component